jgi:hypothetical protein
MKLPAEKDYPSEIHVGEETYQIRFVSKLPGGRKRDIALCNPQTRTIHVKRGLTKSQLLRTVVHEILHALEFEYDIEIPHKLIYQLEKAIVDTLLMNL